MFGYEYGTKPSVTVVGDLEFPQLLADGLVALGYMRIPELFTKTDDDQYDAMGVLDYLLTYSEDVSSTLPPDRELSIEQLLEQIKADTYELIRYVIDNQLPEINNCDLQLMLLEHGLLEAQSPSQKAAAKTT